MAFGLAAAVGATIAKAVKTASDTTKKKGTSSGGSSGSGSSSGKSIEQYQQDWRDANARGDQAGMDAAHRGAEALRAQQGYSSSSDGT